jgi:hypothetical protein
LPPKSRTTSPKKSLNQPRKHPLACYSGVIIIGIAIVVGLTLFSAQSMQSIRDAVINDPNNHAAQAYQYMIRPGSMCGGQGTYGRFSIPTKMLTNENATYSIGSCTAGAGVLLLVFHGDLSSEHDEHRHSSSGLEGPSQFMDVRWRLQVSLKCSLKRFRVQNIPLGGCSVRWALSDFGKELPPTVSS